MRAAVLLCSAALAVTSCAHRTKSVPAQSSAGVEFSADEITPATNPVSSGDIVGTYRFADGFWSWELHLLHDGRFGIVVITDSLESTDDGKVELGSFLDSAGTWTVRNGKVVDLQFGTEADGTKHMEFSVVSVRGRVSLQEPAIRPFLRRVYVHVSDPITGYPKKVTPNHTTEPLSPSRGGSS